MLEDLPMISINVKVMKFWSLILKRTWRSFVCYIPSVFLNITQFLDMIYSRESVDSIIRNLYFLVLWFNTTMRTTNLLRQMHKFDNFLMNFERMYHEIEESEDASVIKRLEETTKIARKIAISNLFLGTLVSAGFVFYPLVTNEPALPYGMTIPGIDKYAEPYYIILYTYQVIITPIGCCMYIPFTSIVVAFMMFGALIAYNLQSRLRHLKQEGDSDKLVLQRIVCYTQSLNDLFTYIAMLEFLTFGATLCALLFLLNIAKSFEQSFIVCTYIIMILMQIFNLYWFANELSVQSEQIATVAYDAPWTEFDTPSRRALQMIMIRAQEPLAIMVGNVYPMTMQIFQSVLNAAYSFFTILRRFYD